MKQADDISKYNYYVAFVLLNCSPLFFIYLTL